MLLKETLKKYIDEQVEEKNFLGFDSEVKMLCKIIICRKLKTIYSGV